MSPLNDELRAALSSRTDSLSPSPDLFAGVERRATRMRRQRVAAAVAGSALAVTALGLGGPMLAGSLTSIADGPLDQAAPQNVDDFALDPANPWPYRGDIVVQAPVEPVAKAVWAEQQGVPEDEVRLSLLYGTLPGPPDLALGVYVASAADGRASWGLVRADRRGVVILLDAALEPGTVPTPIALPVVLPGEEVQSLLIVAAPQTQVQYCPVLGGPCDDGGEQGIAVVPLDGDRSGHGYRVIAPDGRLLDEGLAPYGEIKGEREGAEGPAGVDTADYALDLSEPWAYRGPDGLARRPDLASTDEQLFTRGGSGRSSWSSRPLAAVELDDGLRVLVAWHATPNEPAVVTTTWQRQDEAPQQSEQVTTTDTVLLQSFVPSADGSGLLLALASPRVGAVETTVPGAGEPVTRDIGLSAWRLPARTAAGSVLLYAGGERLLLHAERARLN